MILAAGSESSAGPPHVRHGLIAMSPARRILLESVHQRQELGLNTTSFSALVGPTSEDAAAGAREVPAPSFLRLVRPPE